MTTLELTKERKENWGAIDIFGDVGRIELFIFARNARHSFMAECSFFQVSTASVVKASELIDICPVINELLGKKCFIQAFKYEGKLNFKGDIFQEISVEEIMPWKSIPLLEEQNLYKMPGKEENKKGDGYES